MLTLQQFKDLRVAKQVPHIQTVVKILQPSDKYRTKPNHMSSNDDLNICSKPIPRVGHFSIFAVLGTFAYIAKCTCYFLHIFARPPVCPHVLARFLLDGLS